MREGRMQQRFVDNTEKIKQWIRLGKSCRQIADLLGMAHSSMRDKVREQLGAEVFAQMLANGKRRSEEAKRKHRSKADMVFARDAIKIRKMIEDGLTCVQIAYELGFSHTTVRTRVEANYSRELLDKLYQNGIQRRYKSVSKEPHS